MCTNFNLNIILGLTELFYLGIFAQMGPLQQQMSLGSSCSCANDPNFAIICAFLQKFGHDLNIDIPNFKQLQEWLTKTDEGMAA